MTRKFTLLLLLKAVLFLSIATQAQEVFIKPASKLLTNFAFKQFSGGVILVTATVNDYPDSLNFIFDTGSGGISLDSTTCALLHIQTSPSDKTIRGIGGIRTVSFVNNARLHLPGLTVDSLDFHVNDYDILSGVYGVRIDGIIGYSFLSRYIVRLNYDSLTMQVFSPGEFKYKKGGHILRPLFTSLPIQHVKFKDDRDMTGRFYFDTGAGICFLLSQDYAEDSSVLAKKRKKPVVTQAEGLGGKMQMKLTTVKEVKLGPYKFKNVPTYVFDDEYNVTSYPYLGGLIGNDLLRRFNVTLNYPAREIHIIPNAHYNDLFDYAYTGLGIYYVEGKVVVEDVIPGSPAEEAGFEVGDIIFAINNVFNSTISNYKNQLQTVGEKMKIIVMRKGLPIVVWLKPHSIL